MYDLGNHSVASLAGRIRAGELRAEAVMEEAIAAHDRQGPYLNAYVEWGGESALQAARDLDLMVAAGQDPGPLAGVPVSVKDLYGIEGFSTRAGTVRALPRKWETEGFLVRRLKATGALVVGKTHTVELAYGGVGMNPHWGTPRNPWDRKRHRVPGGSSSGAGVSLCEGSALIAVGSDTGGSIRIPASVTGNVGHKQTIGRWPTDGVVPLSSTLDAVGFLTRTVADTAFVFGVVDAAVGRGIPPASPPRPSAPRVGVVTSAIWDAASPGVADTVIRSLQELEAHGWPRSDVPGSLFDAATDLYLGGGVISAECSAFLDRELEGWLPLLDPIVAGRLEGARDFPPAAYAATLHRRAKMARSAAALFEDVDLLVTPTVPLTPPLVGDLEDLEAYVGANRAMLSGTCPVNFLDLCAISVPVGMDDAGMPVGLQLIAPRGRDQDLLHWALACEANLGNGADRLGELPISPSPLISPPA